MGQRHFISAGAGSGKTHRLTEILHRELADGRAHPAGVIATTFTRRAASELRERVRQHLLAQGEFALANAMGEARIGTVNAVCGEIIQRFAFEAGLPPEQRVLDERQAELLVREAVDAVTDADRLQRLLGAGNRLGIWRDEWQKMLREIMQRARVNDIGAATLATFGERNAADLLAVWPGACAEDLGAALAAALPPVIAAFETALAKKFQKNIDVPAHLMRDVLAGLDSDRLAWSQWLKLGKAADGGGMAAALKPVFAPVAAIAARVPGHPRLHEDLRSFLVDLFALAADALAGYAQRKRALGVLDFADQEYLLLGLLDDPHVAATLGEELDLLLVDEFQDTSPIQLALFLRLARFAKRSYWVGDVKQAIYGFRESDTALMEAVLGALRAGGDEPETLATSRRSRCELVEIVNAAFVPAFAPKLAAADVRLAPLRDEPLTGPAFGNWAVTGTVAARLAALTVGLRRLVESGYVVFDRHEKRARPVRWGDIALLCRKNDRVKAAAKALREAGIPWATEQPGLLGTAEATLALACLRRLNDPADTLATAEIVAATSGAAPEEWVAERLRHLAAGGDDERWRESGANAHPMVARLAELRDRLPRLTPCEAVELVIAECDLAGAVLRWTPTEAAARVRLANLEALVGLARDYEDHCRSTERAATLAGFLLWLEELADQELDLLAAPAIDAVVVLTHHKAKGLEWPVVIVFDLDEEPRSRLWGIEAAAQRPIDATAPLAERFIRCWPWPFGSHAKTGFAADIEDSPLGQTHRERTVGEELRLLYVSMTRARDLLILAFDDRKASPWLDLLAAPWLRLAAGADRVVLPDGHEVPALRWELEAPEDGTAAPEPRELFWFAAPADRERRLPLRLLPSAVPPAACALAEQVEIGRRIAPGGADMNALGNALHACLAADLADPHAPLSREEVADLLAAQGLLRRIDVDAVHAQLAAFRGWLGSRWPVAEVRTEVPVESCLPNGQRISGRIDLLLRTPAGCVLIDHKASARPREDWPAVAQAYAGQLAAYAEAVERAGGAAVVERWLFFPVAAGAVRIVPQE
ncbi:MAG: UvrD-helicase domain-containing protein [Steroidobacteraceae bacterium]